MAPLRTSSLPAISLLKKPVVMMMVVSLTGSASGQPAFLQGHVLHAHRRLLLPPAARALLLATG